MLLPPAAQLWGCVCPAPSVTGLLSSSYHVGMCGDGANDCGVSVSFWHQPHARRVALSHVWG